MTTSTDLAPDGSEVLFRRQSERQYIELVRELDGSISLTLDDYWQFSSRDEQVFHEVLVDVALRVAPRIDSVLILGGGDGLALRNVLRYPGVRRAVVCEIDAAMIEMTRDVPAMVELTQASLADARAEVIIEDALSYLAMAAGSGVFDVVICDFPVAGEGRAAPLFDAGLCRLLARGLAPEGVLSVQVSQDPDEFWPVLQAMQFELGWTEARLAELSDNAWADFILASSAPKSVVRALAPGLCFLDDAACDAITIQNREGSEFCTQRYGIWRP